MLLIINKKATQKDLKKMAEDYDGYIKVVVDLQLKILAGGGKRHVEGEQKLLAGGSKQQNLWGEEWIINLRLNQDNPSRDIMSSEIRKEFDRIVKDLIL